MQEDPEAIEVVRRTARLARLELSPQEEAGLAADFGRILVHFQVLQEVDVEGVGPLCTPSPALDVLRADEPRTIATSHPPLEGAPESREGFFVVPKTVGGEG